MVNRKGKRIINHIFILDFCNIRIDNRADLFIYENTYVYIKQPYKYITDVSILSLNTQQVLHGDNIDQRYGEVQEMRTML